MTPRHLAEARQRIGWSQEQLAHSLSVPAARVRAWEEGRAALPGRVERDVEEKLAWAEYEAAVRAAGIPPCEWAGAWNATPFPQDEEGVLRSLRELEAHEKACLVCTARKRYAELHPPPATRPRRSGLLLPVLDRVERLPEALRPVALGALAFGALALLGVLAVVLGNGFAPGTWANALRVLAAAIVAGGAGGAAYLAARPLRTRVPGAGPYLLGIICAGTCAGVAGLLVHLAGGGGAPRPERWIALAVLSLIAGLAMGHGWFRSGRSGRP